MVLRGFDLKKEVSGQLKGALPRARGVSEAATSRSRSMWKRARAHEGGRFLTGRSRNDPHGRDARQHLLQA